MLVDPLLSFGSFQIDPQNARLWRGRRMIALTPKAFAVLCYLVEHSGQLVTKDALLTTVWPEIYVSEGVLSECVREIRKALGDTPQTPHFIQTAHRRGYRFIGKVVGSQQSVANKRKQRDGNWQLTTHLVGRETELAQLQKWLKRALDGARQLVFVTGEAGIGKTTVMDAFVARLSAKNNVWIGRGQCIDHYGQGEAYLPVLEALGRMCRESEGNQIVDLLSQHAPTWLVQMPALLTTTDLESLQRRTQGATRERMLRELAEAVEVLSAERPLVLFLEDLHWSDVSTLDWLAFVARRREPARLLIIGAYRPVEVIVGDHSLKSVKQELQLHGQCNELPLRFLIEEHVATYLLRRFASPMSAGKEKKGLTSTTLHKLTQLIHQRTEGNPLFMVNLVDYLVAQGVLARSEGQWRLQGEVTAVEGWVPESLQQMIEKQIERLSPQGRRVLEVASVVGAEFSSAAVAAGAGIAVEAVEEHCAELARHEQFLQARGTADWPDGTVTARYNFQHALYQEVLYQRLTVSRRQRLHQRIGERLEKAYGQRAGEFAAELAVHFEQGQNYRKAIQYLEQAGKNSTQRVAYVEAVQHLTKALELLKTLPDTAERARQELALQLALSFPLMETKGYGVPEVEKVLSRAYELCQQVGEPQQLFPALGSLAQLHFTRGEHRTSHELAEQMLRVAQSVQDQYPLSYAHLALGWSLYIFGEFTAIQTHAEQAIALYDPQQHPRSPFFMNDPRVSGPSLAAWALWYLGYPDQSLQRSQEALAVAKEMAHPASRISVLVWAAMFHLTLRREGLLAGELAEAGVALATEQGFPYWVAYGTVARGGALAMQGREEEGIAQMQQGLAALRAIGTVQALPRFLAVRAEAYGRAGQVEEGLDLLAEALALVDKTGERYYEAELYRLKGELTLAQSKASLGQVSGKSKTSQKAKVKGQKSKIETSPRLLTPSPQEAEACFLKAIEIAQRQQAKSLELRATVSLARLWQRQGKTKQAHEMLAKLYNWFTEGFDTKDLQEAKALLGELAGC